MEFPLEFCNGFSAQKISLGPITWWKESDDILMCIRLDTVPECDGQTDGRTDLLKQYRALHAQHVNAR